MINKKRYPMPIPFGWYVVEYADELKPGDVKSVRYFAQDQVLFRTTNGEVSMLDAYCPHLGAHLGHGGIVNGECIECPFHAWRWKADGKIGEIPYAKNIPQKAKDTQIFKYPTVERNNLIYAWYHPHGEQPHYDVETYPEVNDPEWGDEFEKYEYEIKCHIQDMAENAVDAAHFMYVHGVVSYPEFEVSYDKQKRFFSQQANMETPRGVVKGKISGASNGPGDNFTKFEGICDTLLLGSTTPTENEEVITRFSFLQKKVDGKVPSGGVGAAIIADINKQVKEDIPVWENKKYASKPVLCDSDGPIAKFRKHFSSFYAEYNEAEAIEALNIDQ
ncbi:Rieske (2Fe-2S) protein [Gammaproteobacteria bacterium]|nr:Rieske (2Fe-2S) protein [Gammaproteobacteria bacterium]